MNFRSMSRRAVNLFLIGTLFSAASIGEETSDVNPILKTHKLRFETTFDYEDETLAGFVESLNRRLDARATASVAGKNRVDVEIFGEINDDRLDEIRNILGLGEGLEFRITADATSMEDKPIIELARKLPPEEDEVERSGQIVAEWVRYSEKEFGGVDENDGRNIPKRIVRGTPQALVLIDPWNVKGEYLQSAAKGVDERGGFAVHMTFNHQGARRFGKLTGRNTPNKVTGAVRYLGIIFNKTLVSAPSIQMAVSENIQISGRTMTEAEIDDIIAALHEGEMLSPLREISEPAAK